MSTHLTTGDTMILLPLLENENLTVASLEKSFLETFPVVHHFRIACGICMLLFNETLTQTQPKILDENEYLLAHLLMIDQNLQYVRISEVYSLILRPVIEQRLVNNSDMTKLRQFYEDNYGLKKNNSISHTNILYNDNQNDDSNINLGNLNQADIQELLTTAITTALNPRNLQQLINAIKNSTSIHQFGFVPQRLPELVENNPNVAIELLLKAIMTKQPEYNDYLSALINMDASLHSMEVVNRLSNEIELPSEFINLYISNCITSCENIKEKYLQSRQVRLLCVLLQSLMRNKVLNVQDLFVEIQSFCIQFSWIKEASALFRLLKTNEYN